jgi:hypothetical protein
MKRVKTGDALEVASRQPGERNLEAQKLRRIEGETKIAIG